MYPKTLLSASTRPKVSVNCRKWTSPKVPWAIAAIRANTTRGTSRSQPLRRRSGMAGRSMAPAIRINDG